MIVVALVAVLAAACAPVPVPPPGDTPSTAPIVASLPSLPAETTTGATEPEPLYLDVSPSPAFAGDTVAIEVASANAGGPTDLLLDSVTVHFGDGRTSTEPADCSAYATIRHRYATGGDFRPKVTAVTTCAGSAPADIGDAVDELHVFPAAPAASAGWPVCRGSQMTASAPWTGFGLGNVAVLVRVRNAGATACRLEGYPSVRFLARDGTALPIRSTEAADGAYLFPAIEARRVGLRPGETASFMIGGTDTPGGVDAQLPYDVACPPSTAISITLPAASEPVRAGLRAQLCGGRVEVSPIVPGGNGLRV
jgi:hypothetical protein